MEVSPSVIISSIIVWPSPDLRHLLLSSAPQSTPSMFSALSSLVGKLQALFLITLTCCTSFQAQSLFQPISTSLFNLASSFMSLPFPFPPFLCTKPQSTLVCFCYLSTYSTFSLPLNTFLYFLTLWTNTMKLQNCWLSRQPLTNLAFSAKLLILACIWNKIEVISTANISVLTVLFFHFIVTVAIYLFILLSATICGSVPVCQRWNKWVLKSVCIHSLAHTITYQLSLITAHLEGCTPAHAII